MDDLAACLRLSLSHGIGPVSARKVIGQFSTPRDMALAGKSDLRAAGLSEAQTDAFLHKETAEKADAAIAWAQQDNQHIVLLGTPQYPERLARIHDAPLVLYVVGDIDVLHTPQLAMVGSRKPTPSGARTAFDFAKALSERGLCITSGLALGIDAESHRGCLASDGLTVAVAATGLDRVYPAKHRDLAWEIVANGAMVSEMPLGSPVRGPFFTRRNRLISGLSIGTLVVEAAVRSGSLTTARHASEQGREVLAIPGSIHNPMARGCHSLIRQGAKLVETADDVLEELAGQIGPVRFPDVDADKPEPKAAMAAEELHPDPQYRRLLDCLDHSPQGIDRIIERCELPAQEVASMLLVLELEGHISSAGANRYMRCK